MTNNPDVYRKRPVPPLHIHFYRPPRPMSWWMGLWNPRWSHCCLQWRDWIVDSPYNGPTGWYDAIDFLRSDPPDVRLTLPVPDLSYWQGDHAMEGVHEWTEKCKVNRVGAALRYLTRRGGDWGCYTCTRPAVVAIRLFQVDDMRPVLTPDELWDQCLKLKGVQIWKDVETGSHGPRSAKS